MRRARTGSRTRRLMEEQQEEEERMGENYGDNKCVRWDQKNEYQPLLLVSDVLLLLFLQSS